MSFVDGILQLAPPGSNPYAYAAEFVATIIPRKPSSYFRSLIVFGSFAAVNLLATIASFIVLWRRSRSGSGIGFWFFKAQYGHSSGVPYIMPNALTMFLLWNTIFMAFMQPYIWLNYVSYHSPSLHTTSSMYFWYGFLYIWDGVGMWLSAFGTLYAILLPRLLVLSHSENRTKATLLHPVSLNSFCLVPPAVLIVTQVTTSIFSVIAWSNIVHTQFGLIEMLTVLASQWASSDIHTVEKALRQQAIMAGSLFMRQKDISKAAFQRNAGTCAAWYWLCVVLFTPTAVWLMSVISDSLKHQTRRTTTHIPPAEGGPQTGAHPGSELRQSAQSNSSFSPPSFGRLGAASWSNHNDVTSSSQESETVRQLRWAYLTVGLQFSAIFFCMGAAAGGWLWTSVDAERMIRSRTLHSFAILWCMGVFSIVGCLVNLFILIRIGRPSKDSKHPARSFVPVSRLVFSGFAHDSQTSSALNPHLHEESIGMTSIPQVIHNLDVSKRCEDISCKGSHEPKPLVDTSLV